MSRRQIRYAERERETAETKIQVVLDLDGGHKEDISTGIGFFDHMLELMAFHAQINLGVRAEGDLGVDDHHTVEDVGITLGQVLREAIGSQPIERYADCTIPMDDALVQIALDFSGRGQLFYSAEFKRPELGRLSTECIREFFQALAMHAGVTIHIRQISGFNEHHICEAMFKAMGRALRAATTPVDRKGPNSTKGKID